MSEGNNFDEVCPLPKTSADPVEDPELGAIEGVVFEDTDVDGQLNGADGPVSGVTVNLFDEDGNLIATTVTDSDGIYRFEDLEPGTYQVEIIPPPGEQLTISNLGSDSSDSDFSASTNLVVVTVIAGQITTNIDAGLIEIRPILPSPVVPPPEAPTLAFTGVESTTLALIALILIGAGAFQLRFGRRTKDEAAG